LSSWLNSDPVSTMDKASLLLALPIVLCHNISEIRTHDELLDFLSTKHGSTYTIAMLCPTEYLINENLEQNLHPSQCSKHWCWLAENNCEMFGQQHACLANDTNSKQKITWNLQYCPSFFHKYWRRSTRTCLLMWHYACRIRLLQLI
jgi:hypothetical protein